MTDKKTPSAFFKFIATAKGEGETSIDKAVLNSLDIIDTKSGGLAGLVGGFSAAASFALQMGTPWTTGPGADTFFLGLSLLAMGVSGCSCALALNIISHNNAELFDESWTQDTNGISPLEKIYIRRVGHYRRAHRLFLLGTIFLAIGIAFMFAERLWFQVPTSPIEASGAVLPVTPMVAPSAPVHEPAAPPAD